MCVYIHVSECIETVYELPLVPKNTASETILQKIGSGAKCWLDNYDLGPDVAVTGRIRDIGQNGIYSSF